MLSYLLPIRWQDHTANPHSGVIVLMYRMVISTGVGEASSVGAGRCAYRICFQASPLTSLTAKSERST